MVKMAYPIPWSRDCYVSSLLRLKVLVEIEYQVGCPRKVRVDGQLAHGDSSRLLDGSDEFVYC